MVLGWVAGQSVAALAPVGLVSKESETGLPREAAQSASQLLSIRFSPFARDQFGTRKETLPAFWSKEDR